MKRTNSIIRTVSESIAVDLLGESKPILDEEDNENITEDPSKTVKWTGQQNAVVVAIFKSSDKSVGEVPLGQIPGFQFADYTTPDSFWDANKNLDKFKELIEKNASSKNKMLEKWKSENKETVDAIKSKPGFVGFDIIPNKTKVKSPEPEQDGEKEGEENQNQDQNQNQN